MILVIDIGNTHSVFAFMEEGGQARAAFRMTTDRLRTEDEYYAALAPLMGAHDIQRSDVEGAIISSVVPQANFAVRKSVRDFFSHEGMMVDSVLTRDMISVALATPAEIGADRLVNAIAAAKFYHAPAIVIDFGTATTFDVIDVDNAGKPVYCGGAIALGAQKSLQTLKEAAARLPEIDVAAPQCAIGRDTVSAMQSGVFYGYIGLIEGITARIRKELKQQGSNDIKVIATGGLAGLFANKTDAIDVTDEDLTIKGLYYIYQQKNNKDI